MSPLFFSPVFRKLRETFARSLDSSWFTIIAENSALELSNLRNLREFINNTDGTAYNVSETLEMLGELEELIRKTRDCILPALKERLQISPLAPEDMVEDSTERLLRRCVAYTLPHNLAELARLIGLLQAGLEDGAEPIPGAIVPDAV